jgi:starch synthase
MAQRYRAAILSAESVPFAKVGGLGDVVGALSRAVADLGCSVAVFLPRYADLQLPPDCELELVAKIDVKVGGEDRPGLIYHLKHPAHPPHYHHFFIGTIVFRTAGGSTTIHDGEPFRDNGTVRLLLASMPRGDAGDRLRPRRDPRQRSPDRAGPRVPEDPLCGGRVFQMTANILSIHNLGYQGVYPPETMAIAGFPERYPLSALALRVLGNMNFLKAGISSPTASPRSANATRRIQSGEEFGFGLRAS